MNRKVFGARYKINLDIIEKGKHITETCGLYANSGNEYNKRIIIMITSRRSWEA